MLKLGIDGNGYRYLGQAQRVDNVDHCVTDRLTSAHLEAFGPGWLRVEAQEVQLKFNLQALGLALVTVACKKCKLLDYIYAQVAGKKNATCHAMPVV